MASSILSAHPSTEKMDGDLISRRQQLEAAVKNKKRVA